MSGPHKLIEEKAGSAAEKPKLPGIMKEESASVTDKYAKYLPSKEEIVTIANLIERITGMEVDEQLKKGKAKIRVVTGEQVSKINEEEMRSAMGKSINPKVLEKFEQHYAEDRLKRGDNSRAFFSHSKDTLFLIGDAIEKGVKNLCEMKSIKPDSPEGRRIERYLVLSASAHELVHRTTGKNSPQIRREAGFEGIADGVKILSEFEDIKNKDPKRAAILTRSSGQHLNRMYTMQICDEGISYYAERKIMCELGYADWAEAEFRIMRSSLRNDDTYKQFRIAMVLLDHVEEKIKANPVAFLIRNPPKSLEEIGAMMK